MPAIRQSEVETPHLALPLRFAGINGGALVNEQDSTEDIVDCVKAVLAYPTGSNVATPGFGVPDIPFAQTTAAGISDGLREAIAQWEPRSGVIVTEHPIVSDELVRKLTVQIREGN